MAFQTVMQLSRAIQSGVTSAAEVVTATLDDIAATDDRFHAFALVRREAALAEAAQADAELRSGFNRGPLHGVPIAVKDLLWTKGEPTCAGTRALADWRPDEDATVVTRLRRAGAVIVGKTQMTEGAMIAHHPEIPAPRNPWSADRCAGFSSSGSGVAVAAGLCPVALGSDTGGSVRIPSCMNGVTGIKPTRGRVSRHGVFPLVGHLDTIGPLARTAEDCAAVLSAIAGADPADPTTAPLPVPNYLHAIGDGAAARTIGFDRAWFEESCDGEVVAMLDAAAAVLADLGAKLVPIDVPRPEMGRLIPLITASAAEAHRATYPERAALYGPTITASLEHGRSLSGTEVIASGNYAEELAGLMRHSFSTVDMVLMPVWPIATPLAGAMESDAVAAGSDRANFTIPINIAGNPAIALPGGFDARGIPLGFQLVGRWFGEGALLAVGHAFQKVTDWHLRRSR